ncbi:MULTISPECIES: caspase family protein [unclassified Siphonobacter]|uniref:caspase family protein n=1 Tax=unclassified Siphonobacter TaxID=2635712 RepID=UPI002780F9DE|nr:MULTISPECIES: caspase family protein [unclassified Siphonobacter]MDQ1089711.1 hypothetical protein [Siphonobacter sp. SORGH_AS_1065]MDR6197262.1 hypothetical protein [Siphonobacter sp. SORGH_AS_0500]
MKKALFFSVLLAALPFFGYSQTTKNFSTGWEKPDIKLVKPSIVWQSPSAPELTVNQPVFKAKVCVQSSAELTNYHFVLNGKTIGGVERGFRKSTTCGQEITHELTLVEGNNELHFVAVNKGGTTTSESHYITYKIGATIIPRSALILANSAYPVPLKNPLNDGRALESHLKKLGYEVTILENKNLRELKSGIDAYTEKLSDKTISLFFYAGHGLMVKRENYIVPTNVHIGSESDVEYECFALSRLVDRMKEKNPNGSNLVLWDACRNNPYRSWTRGVEGAVHTNINPPVGTMIIYATEPGKTAIDNAEGSNGLFTGELVRHIQTPDIDIYELMRRIDKGLADRNTPQTPYPEGTFRTQFMFNPSLK